MKHGWSIRSDRDLVSVITERRMSEKVSELQAKKATAILKPPIGQVFCYFIKDTYLKTLEFQVRIFESPDAGVN